MLSRRDFLIACGSAGAVTPLTGLIEHAVFRGQPPSLELFSMLVGERFDVADPASGRQLGQVTLVAVEAQRNSSAMIEQFSLHLASGRGPVLAGAIYALRHPAAGELDVRVERVSTATADGDTAYRVDFALLRAARA